MKGPAHTAILIRDGVLKQGTTTPQRHFSVLTPKDHGDIYCVHNLPPEVAATLNGVYSRSRLSMRDQFLDRLKKGLEATGQSLEDIDIPDEQQDTSPA